MFLSEKLEKIIQETNTGVKLVSGETVSEIRKAQQKYIRDKAMEMKLACLNDAIEKSYGGEQASRPQLKRVNLEFKRTLAKHPYLPMEENALEKFIEESYGIFFRKQ